MYSAYKSNEHSDTIQPWCTPFPILNKSIVLCPVLTVSSWPTYTFLRRQERWSGTPIYLRLFTVCCDAHSKKLSHCQWSRSRSYFETPLFSPWPNGCWQFDLSFLFSSKLSLYIWKFRVYILLMPSLKDFEHYFASMWNKKNCMAVWAFFGIALLLHWNENWPFPVLWPLLSFPNLLAYWVQHFNSIIFRVWNRSTGIPSPPLNLFLTMLPEAHLTSHSRMFSSWWVTTPLWLFGSWRPFFYSSSMYSFITLWLCSFLSLFFSK